MPTNYSRDTHTQPLLPSHQCRPISPSFRFCAGDITALVVAAVSIWYIVWGIPLTIRCYKFLSAKVKEHRRRRFGVLDDVEKTAHEGEDKEDPYLSPTTSLRTRLYACKTLATPAPVYSPYGSTDAIEADRSDGSSPTEPSSQSSSEVLFKTTSGSSLSGIHSPASTRSDGLVSSSPLATSPKTGQSGNADIASTMPACPPVAHLDPASGKEAATCKPCTW